MYKPFDEMPASARVWIYQADRAFSDAEKQWIQSVLTDFCHSWNTHGQGMPTSFDIAYDQFILFAVDERGLGASGCSIDSSVRIIRSIQEQLGVNLLDSGKVSFIQEKKVVVNKLAELRDSIAAGELQPDSAIFSPTVQTKQDLAENWIIPAKESWLKRFFTN